MAMQSADFEYHGDKEKTRKNRIGAFFTAGDVGSWTRTATCSCATGRST